MDMKEKPGAKIPVTTAGSKKMRFHAWADDNGILTCSSIVVRH